MKNAGKFVLPLCMILCFLLFDTAIFLIFTKPCLSDRSRGMQAKSIELDKYLPFEENSEIVKVDSEYKLNGNLPVIDGAAALYPVFSAFANALYPENQVIFDGKNFMPGSKLQMNNTREAYKEVVPIGSEAFFFIVNSSNPVKGLTVEQIKGVYNGTYKFWSQVGGDRSPINPLRRNEGRQCFLL